jgi:hypothetical protein
VTHPLRSTGITPLHSYYEAVRDQSERSYGAGGGGRGTFIVHTN